MLVFGCIHFLEVSSIIIKSINRAFAWIIMCAWACRMQSRVSVCKILHSTVGKICPNDLLSSVIPDMINQFAGSDGEKSIKWYWCGPILRHKLRLGIQCTLIGQFIYFLRKVALKGQFFRRANFAVVVVVVAAQKQTNKQWSFPTMTLVTKHATHKHNKKLLCNQT